MITCYFGVPGAGKSTLLTMFAVKELNKMAKGKSKYKHVYSNFYIKGVEQIDFRNLSSYKFYDSLILLDEITIDADNRDFKSFDKGIRDFFILHRHLNNDVIYATQNYANTDKKIRDLTADLWYMSKSVVPFLSGFTVCHKIYRNININEFTSELVMGYRFASFIERLFVSNTKICRRKKYYRYFDSYEESALETRPVFNSDLWDLLPEDVSISTKVLDKIKISV